MNPIKVTRYRCDYCSRSWGKKSPALVHERHCYKRPDRVPRVGELSNTIRDDARAQWLAESWGHPGAGKIWDGANWVDVPGHKSRSWWTPAGDPVFEDIWPVVDGVRLDLWPAADRLDALKRIEDET